MARLRNAIVPKTSRVPRAPLADAISEFHCTINNRTIRFRRGTDFALDFETSEKAVARELRKSNQRDDDRLRKRNRGETFLNPSAEWSRRIPGKVAVLRSILNNIYSEIPAEYQLQLVEARWNHCRRGSSMQSETNIRANRRPPFVHAD